MESYFHINSNTSDFGYLSLHLEQNILEKEHWFLISHIHPSSLSLKITTRSNYSAFVLMFFS